MVRVSASEFARNFGRYKEIAQREPVEITSHERPSGYLISTAEFDEYQRLKAQRREAFYIHELPDEDIEALSRAEMDPRHKRLNLLLDD